MNITNDQLPSSWSIRYRSALRTDDEQKAYVSMKYNIHSQCLLSADSLAACQWVNMQH